MRIAPQNPAPHHLAPSGLALTLLLALPAPAAADTLDTQARALFDAVFSQYCGYSTADPGFPGFDMERYSFQRQFDAESPFETFTLFHMFCFTGAYNVQSVVLLHRDYEGLRPVAFAEPDLDIDYADAEYTILSGLQITGWSTTDVLVNARIDPVTGQIESWSAWRGLGDASSRSVWDLTFNGYRLVTYEVDPTYDGEITPLLLYAAPGY